jgi:DNA-binding MarR family transcriptional regulator
MSSSEALNRDTVLTHFKRNLPRHIISAALALNERLISHCAAAGHTGLKAAFNFVLSHCNGDGSRSVDIAKNCGITPQAAGQTVNELERLGYMKRKPDPEDKRAKRLVLTAKGKKLMADAQRFAVDLDAELAAVVGAAALDEFKRSSALLYRQLLADTEGSGATADSAPYYLALCLTALATYCEQELMELDKAKGHLRLKMSFGQVIIHISPYGSLINDIAKINGVSKQAISQIVKEVEELGYLERRENPQDARSTKIFLTDYGLQLIRDSVANFSVLEQRFVAVLGEKKFNRFAQTVERLYEHFYLSAVGAMDESQRLHSAAVLQHFIERLYHDNSGDAPLLFTRSGSRARLSDSALKMLAELEIKLG